PGVLQGDGQAEPGTSGGPCPCRVGTPETVEDELVLTWAEAHPVVADRDRHGVPVGRDGDHHVTALTVLDRVVEQVAQHPLHPAPVHLGVALLPCHPDLAPPPPLAPPFPLVPP